MIGKAFSRQTLPADIRSSEVRPETCLPSVAWKAKGGHLKPETLYNGTAAKIENKALTSFY